MHLTRILAQHCAHGGADRPHSLNLKRISPCHSSCTGPCARFGNSQSVNNNWQLCTTMPVDQSTKPRAARTIAVHIHRPTEPLLYAQPALVGAPACATRARTLSRNCRNTYPKRALNRTRTASPWLHTTHRNSARELHNCSVVFRRLRISTGYSQPITAALSAGCKGSIHANSTPIPLQTHGNR